MTGDESTWDASVLTAANAARAAVAGREAAQRARRLLDSPRAQELPDVKLRLLQARVAMPDAPWAEVAQQVGLGKHQAIGLYRRLTAGI